VPTLPVLAVSQFGPAANRYFADCSIACGLSLLLWAGKGEGLTVDSLAAETTLAQVDTGLDMIAIVNLLTAHGLGCRIGYGSTDNIRAEIDSGRPVIVALVWQGRRHALVVRGYDSSGLFIINDPASAISRATAGGLERGMIALGLGRQCVFVADPPPAPLVGSAVTTGAVNVRSGPNGVVIGQLQPGTVVLVLETEGEWSAVTLTAFVATKYLRKS
jgi:hypothetical protein